MSTDVTQAPAAAPPANGGARWSFALREFRFWLTDYRRTWRGSVISSVLGPLLYLGAMGAGLGTLVNRHAGATLGVSYLDFIAPGLLAATAMQTAFGEGLYPVLGSVKWVQNYFAAAASPLRPADVFRGHLLFVILRLTMNCGVFLAVIAAFGAARSALAIAALPAATADRAGVRAGLDGLGGDPGSRHELQRAFPVPDGAAVPVLRHLFPDHAAAGVAAAGGLRDPAVARRAAVPLADSRHRRPGRRGRARRLPARPRGGRLSHRRADLPEAAQW